MKQLIEIQSKLKAPKNLNNNFGNYKYRNCEGILEAVKPLLKDCVLTLSDKVIEVANTAIIEATATISNGKESISVTAQAGVNFNKKGMDIAQSFGSSSSYARKYALNGLFLIDDTKDADETNNHEAPCKEDKDILKQLVYNSTFTEAQKSGALKKIDNCNNYDQYTKIQFALEEVQMGHDDVVNPNAGDIKRKVKEMADNPSK